MLIFICMSGISIKLENVSVNYHHQAVLGLISHVFEPGQVTAILGRSGSGKSTLLRTINGLTPIRKGHIFFGDEALQTSNLQYFRHRTGFVIQHTGLFPHLDIQTNISIPGKITGMDRGQMQVRTKELMDISGLPLSYLHKYPYELSGGEQQRVGLCRALFLDPPLLLMDEPFASLDYVTKQSLYAYLHGLQEKNARTVILVTHDLDEAAHLADAFVWIENGTIREKGDIEKLSAIREAYLKG